MREDTDVLIAGAGPTGLTLAVDLARRGVACRIVERAPEPAAGSKGKGLQPRTLEVFDDLGVIGPICGAPSIGSTSASPTATAPAGSSWPGTPSTCTRRRAAGGSTPVSRTPTTWAGSSPGCSRARRRRCWTPTRRSAGPSPPGCSGSARTSPARSPANATRRPTSSR